MISPPLASWLSKNDLSGKMILPFYSHYGGVAGDLAGNIAAFCHKADVREALSVIRNGGEELGARLLKKVAIFHEQAGEIWFYNRKKEYIKLGNSVLNASRMCMEFGNARNGQHSWTLDEAHSREIIKHGLEMQINFLISLLSTRAVPANGMWSALCEILPGGRMW